MMTDYFERPLQDEQLPPGKDDDEPGNAYCADCGNELAEPCAHCIATYEREQAEEAKYLGI
jgi:hypothetical protein